MELDWRDQEVCKKALTIALNALEEVPKRQRPSSDMADMKALLERWVPDDVQLQTYVRSARWALFGEVPPELL